jgi:hypothetical protein
MRIITSATKYSKERHSGLDPESRKPLIILDSRLRGNDKCGDK